MRDISEMATVLTNKLEQKLEKLKEAQRDTAKVIWEDTVNNAPMSNGGYISSIQLSDTEFKSDVIKTSVFSDLLVGGTIPKWQNVPLAAFMVWGTGPLGEDTNSKHHRYTDIWEASLQSPATSTKEHPVA